MTPDLFSQIVGGLWFALESYGPLTSLVPVANRVHFNLLDDANKPSLNAGDFPQLAVLPAPGGGDVNPVGMGASSDSDVFVMEYVLGLLTDEKRTGLPRSVDPVKWACLRALQRFAPRLPGCPYVRLARFGPFGDQIADIPGVDNLAPGWKSVMRFRVVAVLGKGRLY